MLYGIVLDTTGSLDVHATQARRAVLKRERLPDGRDRPRAWDCREQPQNHANDEPFREYLTIHNETGTAAVRCTQCSLVLCSQDEDWTQAAARRRMPPTAAGPLMFELDAHYLLEQLYCPSCAVLLRSEIIPRTKQT
jgi:hypothetical protein